MSTMVLVHGFWHGAWCWSEVVPHVVAGRRLAVAVDMAGHGLYARPGVQAKFIAEADAAFPDNPTSVVTLDASHSPFLSKPGELADILIPLGRHDGNG
ncbi:Alpha/beta hydrolase family protein [Nonomuraea coxensis DSM 45129]|uniref:Alpha/beta hydrolase family protein n=1 Tax=Nonomuraea coxensis DSM 45129 TaxID=1122611 RepID=A0ABX8TQP1_9ACTN|nr:hypothetical protein [Nonomuraea coxensis]QYC37810.1 Alpha/beta hydrolase family protein [Nonomuraea coxensis DSM 45129]